MDKVRPSFRKSAEILASYEAVDFASGIANQTFYNAVVTRMSGQTITSGAVLTNTAINSQFTETDHTTTSIYSSSKIIEYDFDTAPFNKPRTLNGKALIEIPYYMTCGTGGTGTTAYFVNYINKVASDGTETILVSGQTITESVAASVAKNGFMTLELTVPKTRIMKDEKIRVTTEMWSSGNFTGGQSSTVIWGHDPGGRDRQSKFDVTPTMKTILPFELPT